MPHDLTPREVEVTRLISLGCSVPEIARILGLSDSTIDSHRSRAMAKLGIRKAVLLTRWAIKLRITKAGETLTPAEKRKRGRKRDGWN